MKQLLILFIILTSLAWFPIQDNRTTNFPKEIMPVQEMPAKKNVWVFLMAGQSNMAGRGLVEPEDTISNKRIWSMDAKGQLIYAKEPLHFYEPTRTGLDCGVSFARTLLKNIPENVSILLVPTAIGGSSIQQWLGDSLYRGVHLMQNFEEKLAMGKKYGTIKGILWHQGESDAKPARIAIHQEQMDKLVSHFRDRTQIKNLPFIIGELGAYSNSNNYWQQINQTLAAYTKQDRYARLIHTQDLKHGGDSVHFNSEGQRLMGKRFAEAYWELAKIHKKR